MPRFTRLALSDCAVNESDVIKTSGETRVLSPSRESVDDEKREDDRKHDKVLRKRISPCAFRRNFCEVFVMATDGRTAQVAKGCKATQLAAPLEA
jgi:hypothetical protein